MDPIGRDACELPQVAGPCDGYYTRWSYDAKSKNCKQFQYGGCLGNNNRVSIYFTFEYYDTIVLYWMIHTNFGMNNFFSSILVARKCQFANIHTTKRLYFL